MKTIRVFVVDDHPMFRRGLAAMINAESEFEWVGEAADGAEAVRAAPGVDPDVVLMDLVMPNMDGIAALQALRPLLPHTRFVVLTCQLDAADVHRAIAAGASCFVLKEASAQELVTVIHAAHGGRRLHSPGVTDALVASQQCPPIGADLTKRERKLLSLMACGMGNQEISERLEIAMPTVKFHVTNILAKLQAENRTAAVLVALRHKLVQLDPAVV